LRRIANMVDVTLEETYFYFLQIKRLKYRYIGVFLYFEDNIPNV